MINFVIASRALALCGEAISNLIIRLLRRAKALLAMTEKGFLYAGTN